MCVVVDEASCKAWRDGSCELLVGLTASVELVFLIAGIATLIEVGTAVGKWIPACCGCWMFEVFDSSFSVVDEG